MKIISIPNNGVKYATGIFNAALSQSEEISSDFCCFYGGGIRHNEDIMHSFQNFIVRLIPNHPPPLETRIWKLVVRALIQWIAVGITIVLHLGWPILW